MIKKAVIYSRYSSERQTEQSIEGQLRVCKEYAARENYAIVDTYIDRATTGTNDQRAAFQKCSGIVRRRAFSTSSFTTSIGFPEIVMTVR